MTNTVTPDGEADGTPWLATATAYSAEACRHNDRPAPIHPLNTRVGELGE